MNTREKLLERLQYLWAQASCGCGSAVPQVVDEVREIEAQLDALDQAAAEDSKGEVSA